MLLLSTSDLVLSVFANFCGDFGLLEEKKNPLCVCYFSEQAKSVPSSSFPVPSLSLSPTNPPDYLSSHFFNLILSPVSSSAVPGNEMVHLSGFLSHDWEQQTRFFTCLPFS